MLREYNFSFDELVIDLQRISILLGHGDGHLPVPFDEYLQNALNESRNLTDIMAAYRLVNEVTVDDKKHRVMAEGREFKVGETVCRELKGSEQLAFYVCTAGKTISEKSAMLLKGEDPVLGYVYDLLGSAIAEASSTLMQNHLKQEVEKSGARITNRYSPGYCQWNVADQHVLFSLFPSRPCGVSLTTSALMSPVKSVSGVIGIGRQVSYREYQCELCPRVDCVYRKTNSR